MPARLQVASTPPSVPHTCRWSGSTGVPTLERGNERSEAIELLTERLATRLQIERYLTLAFEQAHEVAEQPVSGRSATASWPPGLDDLEPRLAGHGYNARILAQELDIRQAEVRSFLRGDPAAGAH